MSTNSAQQVGGLGVTRKTVFNWMTSGNIPLGKLIDMADLFGCSIDYLLGRG